MNAAESDLYLRLHAFPIDEGTPDLTFEARLARENAWTPVHARRVVAEYKRFVFLAMTAGHHVTPSEAVDQAWHLHLTYTRSYWDRLCGELLGRPFHHGPTRGGADEGAKFRDQYARTLAAYRRAFGEEPPADVWPPADTRFGDDLREVRVNTARNWVIPKAPVRRTGAAAVAAGVAVAFGTGCGGAVGNPFDLAGTDFLWVLIPALLAALAAGWAIRRVARGPGPRPDEAALDWADAAYLAGRNHRLAAAAIARLTAAELVRVSADGKTLDAVPQAGRTAITPVEEAVFGSLPVARTGLNGLTARVGAAFQDRARELEAGGFLRGRGRVFLGAVAAVLPLAAVVVGLALPRLAAAAQTRKPAGYLIGAVFSSAGAGLLVFASSLSRNTRRADAALKRLRRSVGRGQVEVTDPTAVGVAVAACGTAALAGSDAIDLAALAGWYPRPTPGGGDGGSGGCGVGCGTSGGDGGGGCGGGGCAGGGCGGCGG